jgi:hypothetical protein
MAFGYKHTEEAKVKIREKRKIQKMKPMSDVTKKKIGDANAIANKGKKPHPKTAEGLERLRIFNTGRKMSIEARIKNREAKLKNPVRYWLGKTRSIETKEKISKKNSGKIRSEDFKKNLSKIFSGEKHPRWIKDRSKLAKRQERNDMAYKEWRKSVWIRDGFKCKIDDPFCNGKIIAHHILSWKDYLNSRYDVNNGITLCRFHHPRKRKDEVRLSSHFRELLNIKLI